MPKLQTIQAARGVAANLVVLTHLNSAAIMWTGMSVLPAFSFYSWAGVDIFFVLSGFIMVAVAGRNIGPLEFIWRRAARIYPAYWLASLLVLCLVATHSIIHSSPLELHSSMLWRSFLLAPQSSLPLLVVGWTLVFEMYFYLVFTIFLALRIPIIVGLIAWGAIICGVLVVAPDQVASLPVLHVAANPMTAEFMMGAAIGLLWLNKRMPASRTAGVVGLAILVLSLGYLAPALLATNPHQEAWPHQEPWRVILFGIPAALILYALAAIELRPKSPRLPELVVKLGDWSYGTYLMHVLIISVMGKTMSLFAPAGGIGLSLILVISGFIGGNLAGAVAHVYFERPTLRRLQKLSSYLRPAAKISKTVIGPMQSLSP